MNDNEIKKVSVSIPTYKRSEKLDNILSSIPDHVDVVVSDNGDFTKKWVKDKHVNVKFFSFEKVVDMFINWNNALNQVESEYFLIPADDDLYMKNSFSVIQKYISQYPDRDIMIFGHNVIDNNNNIISVFCPEKLQSFDPPNGFDLMKYGVEARMPSVIFKTKFIKEIGGFDTFFKLTAADSELVQRALLTGKSLFVPEIIGAYRMWDGGLTAQKQASNLWFSEIEYWTNTIAILAEKKYSEIGKKFDSNKYKDEIMAKNILSAAVSLLYKDKNECRQFMKKRGVPRYSLWKTKLSLLKNLFKSYCGFL